eukprot:CAMPEP_0196590678 /NCGR_PEP_ID=MMETSP1081-20130531/67229_1 /TAXON_ID=36882 /ORGANISM="Pyramimonas amylifera, Strain CCMP720" /LENGTH=189 /DNA_ID=CAMNT_0041913833 /DNA_START=101 /DNA_END=666 /DNA_ORIENTATION=+
MSCDSVSHKSSTKNKKKLVQSAVARLAAANSVPPPAPRARPVLPDSVNVDPNIRSHIDAVDSHDDNVIKLDPARSASADTSNACQVNKLSVFFPCQRQLGINEDPVDPPWMIEILGLQQERDEWRVRASLAEERAKSAEAEAASLKDRLALEARLLVRREAALKHREGAENKELVAALEAKGDLERRLG